MFLAIGALWAMELPPFVGADEKAHLGYAHAVADGSLPTITDRPTVPRRAHEWHIELVTSQPDRTRSIWVANHPPLHYMITAPVIWWSEGTDRADGGLLLMRFVNLALGAVGIVLTFALARELTGSRRLALLSAGVAAMTTQMFASLSLAMSDGLAFATGTAVLWAGVRCIQRGPTRSNLALLAAAVAAGAGARGVTMLMGFVTVAIVAGVQLRDRRTDPRDRWFQAVRVALLGTIPAVILFGWFYVRNIALYGDIGASTYLLKRFEREPGDGLVSTLLDQGLWRSLYFRLMSPVTYGGPHPANMRLVLLGGLIGLGIVLYTRRTGDRRASGERYSVARRSLLLLGANLGLIVVYIAEHLSGGGYLHPRYAFPVLAAMATMFVVGLDRLVPRILPAVTLVGMGIWTLSQIPVGFDPAALSRPRDLDQLAPAALRHLPADGVWRAVAAGWIVVGVVTALIAIVILVFAPQRFEIGENPHPD